MIIHIHQIVTLQGSVPQGMTPEWVVMAEESHFPCYKFSSSLTYYVHNTQINHTTN